MMRKSSAASIAAAITGLAVCVILCATWLAAQQRPADLILHDGKIITVDKDFSIAQAVAITGNTIAAVGNDADVMKLKGPSTQVIDLEGRTVVPSLMDTHYHYTGMEYAGNLTESQRAEYRVDWRGVTTVNDVLDQISDIIKKNKIPPGQWIHFNNAVGFMGAATPQTVLQGKILFDELNRWNLDKAAPHNPIIMSEGIPEYNGLLLNGVAMDILWKKYGDFIKQNGRYWIDSSGRPDGHLESVATRPIMMIYEPQPTAQVLAPLFRETQEGLEAIGESVVSGRYPKYRIAGMKLLEQQGRLLQRIAYGLEDDFGVITNLDDLKNLQGTVGSGDDKIWITSIAPSSVDGSGSRMCTNQSKTGEGAIDNLYPMGQCYQDSEYNGAAGHAAPIPKNYYHNWIMAGAKYDIRFANTHMSGDRSVNQFLNMVADAQKQYGPSSTKDWASDHCDLINPADLARAAKMGVIFSCYPNAIMNAGYVDKEFGDKVANTFPAPEESMVKLGMHPAYEGEGSSDNPWVGLATFITRKDRNGHVWGPQEAIDNTTALKTATIWAAEYVLKPDKLGSIEPGKLADMVVLDKDYLTISGDEVAKIRPQFTVFDGKIVFVNSAYSAEHNLKPAGAVISTYEQLMKRRNAGFGF